MECLHGIRFLSISWIVLGHSYGTAFTLPGDNMFNLSEYVSNSCLFIFKYNKNKNTQYIWCCVLILLMLFKPSKYNIMYMHQLHIHMSYHHLEDFTCLSNNTLFESKHNEVYSWVQEHKRCCVYVVLMQFTILSLWHHSKDTIVNFNKYDT